MRYLSGTARGAGSRRVVTPNEGWGREIGRSGEIVGRIGAHGELDRTELHRGEFHPGGPARSPTPGRAPSPFRPAGLRRALGARVARWWVARAGARAASVGGVA